MEPYRPEDVRSCQDELAELDQQVNGLDAELENLNSQREATDAMSEPIYRERLRHVAELRIVYDRAAGDKRGAEADVERLRGQVRSLSERLRTAQTGEQRSRDLRDAADVAEDLQTVLTAALGAIESKQVAELSSVMNRIFGDVIGATEESNFSEVGVRSVPGAIGARVEYEPYALDGTRDKPLAMANGASRRALAVSSRTWAGE